MKRALLILAGFYLSIGPALAADDPLAAFYGNTVVVKAAGGSETRIHYKDDQTYSLSDTERGDASGTWAIEGDKLCMAQTEPKPAEGQEKLCVPSPAGKKVGDSWDDKTPDGEQISVTIVEGS